MLFSTPLGGGFWDGLVFVVPFFVDLTTFLSVQEEPMIASTKLHLEISDRPTAIDGR